MPIAQLKKYLDKEKVKYVTICHSRAYTAQETAASAHVPGKELAKTVMVKIDGKMAMAVLPASFQVDLDQLRHAAGAARVELAGESDFKGLFPQCEVGAMPPFGNLYGMDVYSARELAEDDDELALAPAPIANGARDTFRGAVAGTPSTPPVRRYPSTVSRLPSR